MENSTETINTEVSKFESEIDIFIKHIEAQADIVPLVMKLLNMKRIQESKHVQKYIKENGIIEEDVEDSSNSDGKKIVNLLIPPDKIKKFLELNDVVDTTNLAYELLPVNFVVSFVSQYDAYLGGLIRAMFISKPELLNSSEKNILFSELISFDSISEAKEFVIEKEVESVLRESHLKQFKWLESKLNMQLRDLPSFSDFIEITERRNLFVHCNGVASRQYIEVCKVNGVQFTEKVNIGDKLTAEPEYFAKCYSVLFEIGVKLGQVIWRKLLPNEIKNADSHLNNVCFQLLIKGHYKLAINLLTFATETLKKHYDQEFECIFTINKALGFYLSGKKDECEKVLNKRDWSATSAKFKLAINILRENYPDALEVMKAIGDKDDHINKDSYREWPLFSQFRKRDDFKNTYEEIFNEEFVYVEPKPKSLEDILYDININSETEDSSQKKTKVNRTEKKTTVLKKTPVPRKKNIP